MANVTRTVLDAYLNDVVNPALAARTHFEGTPLMSTVMSETPWKPGSDTISWPVESANSDGTASSEGAGWPAGGARTVAKAVITPQTILAVRHLTGEALSVGGDLSSLLQTEIDAGMRGLMDAAESYCETEVLDGIDDDTTYAGLTRSTYNFSSTDTAGGSGALTEAMLDATSESLQTEGVNLGDCLVFSAHEQRNAYAEIAGTQYNEHNYVFNADTKGLDLSERGKVIFYAGMPWHAIPGFANTYVVMAERGQLLYSWKKRPFVTVHENESIYGLTLKFAAEIGAYVKNPARCARISALAT